MTETSVKNLNDVKVGDVFMRWDVNWTSRLHKVMCERVTDKQAIVGGTKYWKEDAREVGRDKWSRQGGLREFDVEIYKEAKRVQHLDNLRSKLHEIKWKTVPDEAIEKIWDLTQQPSKDIGQ